MADDNDHTFVLDKGFSFFLFSTSSQVRISSLFFTSKKTNPAATRHRRSQTSGADSSPPPGTRTLSSQRMSSGSDVAKVSSYPDSIRTQS